MIGGPLISARIAVDGLRLPRGVFDGSGARATAVPPDPRRTDAYRMLELVEDNVAVVRALGEETAVVIGHDWGATIAANSALVRPEVFRAVGLLSVPYSPRGGPRPSEAFAQLGWEEEFYVSNFQQPGRAEAEIEPDVRGGLAGCYAALLGDTMAPPDPHFVSRNGRLRDRFPVRAAAGLAQRGRPRRLCRGV